jgi:ABC-type polysaccharide/polyol phosphate transport system ATPase subunit
MSNGKENVVRALDNVSLSLEDGDRIGIIGLNGSGKSSLLRVFANIYGVTAGRLEVNGTVSSLMNFGLGIRQESTGRKNIYLRGLMKGLTRGEIREREREIIAFSELEQYIDMPVRMYSAGMGLRLSFAMATAFTPDILLMDEWIGVGDQRFQVKVKERLQTMLQDSGITVLCSHNTNIIGDVCNRVIWLNKGRIIADGAPIEVLSEFSKWRQNLVSR